MYQYLTSVLSHLTFLNYFTPLKLRDKSFIIEWDWGVGVGGWGTFRGAGSDFFGDLLGGGGGNK